MSRGTEKYQWVRASFGSVGFLSLLLAPPPLNLIVSGGCVLAGLVVKRNENYNTKAQLEDLEDFYAEKKLREEEYHNKLKSLEDKMYNGGVQIR